LNLTEAETSLRAGGVRPVLRWAGSKKQIVPSLAAYWSTAFERYVEPFCGSSSLFFRVQPPAAVLSDSNRHLIEFYEVLRESPASLWTDTLMIARNRKTYLELRGASQNDLSRQARAVRFLYLNRNCFNGLYRTDKQGRFNVPFADSRVGEMPSLAEFIFAGALLKNANLRACDFGHTLRDVRAGDFVYLDPPFFVSSRRVFREYGPKTFATADLDRLRRHLDKIASRGAAFVLSFADCAEARAIGRDWIARRIKVRRNIAGFVSDRRSSYELIISNIQSETKGQ
jgi:DNA adenine methylase